MALHPGTRIAHFEIISPVGAGGMGEVYRARDTRLGRDVAIKVLPAEFASDPDRLRRFEQEARAVAALDHPNILALHDVGTHEGAPFIVTELLEGESLRERLHAGLLPVRSAVEIGVQIALGLAAAHEKGIVHRDLKPGNVFVTKDGHVKILDFGIAKLTRPEAGPHGTMARPEPSTDAGSLVGTAGYMSPEQVRGHPVDHRTDIFSFGCVLYEMLCGRSPFHKETTAETMTAILHEDPRAINRIGRQVPPALEGILARCVEKRPEDRFSSAHDLALALRAVAGGSEAHAAMRGFPPSVRRVGGLTLAGVAMLAVVGVLIVMQGRAGPKSGAGSLKKIVVLPFENLGLPEDAYFASGMAEEITSRLANVQGLSVISRTSAIHYDQKGKTVRQVGSDLGVDYVLEGSVRWEHGQGHEGRVRITPRLIRVADDTHVWTDRYDLVLADVFAIQSEVAESVVRAMGVALLPRERTKLKEISTEDVEAYGLYLRGLDAWRNATHPRDVEVALQMYQEAVDRDPRFARALAELAGMHLDMYFLYIDRSPAHLVRAKEAAERAVALRPDLAETHTALGWYFYQGLLDYPRAREEFAAALKIQPNFGTARLFDAAVVRRQGRWAESAEELSKAIELDPKNVSVLFAFAQSCVLARRYADADHALKIVLGLTPRDAGYHPDAAWLQVLWHGDLGKAQTILDEAPPSAGPLGTMGTDCCEQTVNIAMARRDYEGALRLLDAWPHGARDNQWGYTPSSLRRGEVLILEGRSEPARRALDGARLELEQKVEQDPEDARCRSSLGIAYAGLGRRAEAVREARLGCELMPASRDAWRALKRLQDLALVYTMTGRPDEAIAALDDLLSRSGEVTPHVLRLDPRWDPLRSDPRFQALLMKYEVKE